ncbi:MAG: hypothetical protein ACRDA4_08130 [Filifactoraceae bacterium]
MEVNVYIKPVNVLIDNAYSRLNPKLVGRLKYRKRMRNRNKLKRRK